MNEKSGEREEKAATNKQTKREKGKIHTYTQRRAYEVVRFKYVYQKEHSLTLCEIDTGTQQRIKSFNMELLTLK